MGLHKAFDNIEQPSLNVSFDRIYLCKIRFDIVHPPKTDFDRIYALKYKFTGYDF